MQPQNWCFWNIHKTTWARSRKTRSTVKLSSTARTARYSFPQNVSLSEQRTQTTGNAARAPCRPGGHDAVHCRKRKRVMVCVGSQRFVYCFHWIHSANLTTVFFIWAIYAVPLKITSVVQVNTLPTGTGKLFGWTGTRDLWSNCWSAGSWKKSSSACHKH